MTTADRFRKMLVDLELDTTTAGKELAIDRSYVSMLQLGRASPGLHVAARIEQMSRRWRGGLIGASDWLSAATSPKRSRLASRGRSSAKNTRSSSRARSA